MPAAFADFRGLNPTMLQTFFSQVSTASEAARMPAYNEHGADPFKTDIPKFFKIKQKVNKFLEPGQFMNLNVVQRNKEFTKAKFGILETNSSIQATWDFLRFCGPIYLIRCQGPVIHNEDQISTGKASFAPGDAITATAGKVVDQQFNGQTANWDQTGVDPTAGYTYGAQVTLGGYALSLYIKREMKYMYFNQSNQSDILGGSLTARLSTSMTAANEQTYERVVPYEAGLQA